MAVEEEAGELDEHLVEIVDVDAEGEGLGSEG